MAATTLSASGPAVSLGGAQLRLPSWSPVRLLPSPPTRRTYIFPPPIPMWNSIENKSTVFTYGGGALAVLWLSSVVVGAVNSVPLLPKIMELVGLGYTGWFVYRYLLFKERRKELASEIENVKKKIAGTDL